MSNNGNINTLNKKILNTKRQEILKNIERKSWVSRSKREQKFLDNQKRVEKNLKNLEKEERLTTKYINSLQRRINEFDSNKTMSNEIREKWKDGYPQTKSSQEKKLIKVKTNITGKKNMRNNLTQTYLNESEKNRETKSQSSIFPTLFFGNSVQSKTNPNNHNPLIKRIQLKKSGPFYYNNENNSTGKKNGNKGTTNN
jgi:hypothetical protein